MYSLVLMTALTTAPDAPEFNGFFRNLFGGGCSSQSAAPAGCSGSYAPRYNCYGGCTGSAYPAGCSGTAAYPAGCCGGCCGGGGLFSGFGSRVRSLFQRNDGCCGGGCCGGSSYSYGCGCTGSAAYSCFGGPAVSYTPVFNGGLSCQGGPAWPAPAPVFDTFPGNPGAAPPPTIPYAPPESAPAPGGLNTGLRPSGYNAPTLVSNGGGVRANVIVRLPADAKLYIDTRALVLTGPERKFVSPELPAGQEFVYRFRAEYERDGETVSVTKKVTVRAGASVAVEFTDLTARVLPEKGTERNPDKNAGGPAPAATPSHAVAATPTANPTGSTPVTPAAAVPSVMPAAVTAGTAAPPAERATLTVKLPPGATLYVDDRKSPSDEPVRRFSTPPLPAGREFAYLMRAEVVRNGQTETFIQKVPFRAGERVEVDFTGRGR